MKAEGQPGRGRSDIAINNDEAILAYPQTIQGNNYEPRRRTYTMGTSILYLRNAAEKKIRRPFAFINSRIYVHAAEGNDARLVGEAQQSALSFKLRNEIADGRQWHPWRRRYNVFQSYAPLFNNIKEANEKTGGRDILTIRTYRFRIPSLGFLVER